MTTTKGVKSRSKSEPEFPKEGNASVAQAAKFFGVSRVSIWRYVAEGKLPSFKLGGRRLFKWSELHARCDGM